AVSIVPTAISLGPRYAIPTLEQLPVYLFFAFPGWILALPFVLFFKNAEGWRALVILAIGTAIGPGFILTWVLVASGGHIDWQRNGSIAFLSLIIGLLTTVLYVFLLRRFKDKSLVTPPSTI